MAMFSYFKRGRQAAKEHKAKEAAKKEQPAKVPYKHVPTHAAIDALTSAPSGWNNDRTRILEAHRRRSAMVLNSSAMSSRSDMNMAISSPVHNMGGGVPRTQSTLSHVAYPSAHATPIAPPRASSYSGIPTGWSYRSAELPRAQLDSRTSLKGKEVERRVSMMPRVPSSSPASQDVPPGSSSSESSSSQDNLEMRASHRHSLPVRPSSTRAASSAAFTSGSRDTAPVSHLPLLHIPSPLREGVASSSASIRSQTLSTRSQALSISSTATDLDALVADRERRVSPPASLRRLSPTNSKAASEPPPLNNSRRPAKTTRFGGLETINSVEPPRMAINEKTRPTAETTRYLPTEFDFDTSDTEHVLSTLDSPGSVAAPSSPTKLQKSSGGKLTKKNRWSMSSRTTSVVV